MPEEMPRLLTAKMQQVLPARVLVLPTRQELWAVLLAKSSYAALNRATSTAVLNVPLIVLLNTRSHLGHVVSAVIPSTVSTSGIVDDSDPERDTVVGLFQSWSLSITLTNSILNVSAGISLTHVRNLEENEALGVDSTIYR